MFGIVKDVISRSHAILMSQNFEMQNRQCWYEDKRIKYIFADKGNSGTRLGAPLYYLKYSSLFFFNKTDFEQFLFN